MAERRPRSGHLQRAASAARSHTQSSPSGHPQRAASAARSHTQSPLSCATLSSSHATSPEAQGHGAPVQIAARGLAAQQRPEAVAQEPEEMPLTSEAVHTSYVHQLPRLHTKNAPETVHSAKNKLLELPAGMTPAAALHIVGQNFPAHRTAAPWADPWQAHAPRTGAQRSRRGPPLESSAPRPRRPKAPEHVHHFGPK